jgi:ABC-type spermidine/putrescine transport system permease subunit II
MTLNNDRTTWSAVTDASVNASYHGASDSGAQPAAREPAIELRGVSKRYGEQLVLQPPDLQVRDGEFLCLLGPSGCGKTTMLNLIGGFVDQTSGEIYIRGERVNGLPSNRRNVNTVFQSYALFPHMSVEDNVGFGLQMARVPRSDAAPRIQRALERVGLEDWAARLPGQLSGGQQQRVDVARALVNAPSVLLLGEPLGALAAAAFPLVRSRVPFRAGVRVLLTLPIMIPGLLIGVGLLALFRRAFDITLSETTAVIGQALICTPFVVLIVAAQLEGFDASLERAARDLGASTYQRLRYVVFPLISSAVLAAAPFAFTVAFDDFIITLFVIGGANTLPTYIFTQVKTGITSEVNALASLLFVAPVCLLLLGFTLTSALWRIRRPAGYPNRSLLDAS